jgi:hypothetical protein
MQRRDFIRVAAAGAAALAWPGTAPAAGAAAMRVLSSPRLLDLLGDARVVRDLGLEYRQQVPAENDALVLARAILPMAADDAPAALGAQVADLVQRDFADGRIVTVRGWILSVTEARQCALFSLQSA